MKLHRPTLAAGALLGSLFGSTATWANTCSASTGAELNPVIELYTSEGCSSCPPADRWLSTLKPDQARTGAVIQAFHVGYWDYIGWVDRFATPAHTTRQRQIASWNRLRSIYTPQVVVNGSDFRASLGGAVSRSEPARARIELRRTGADQFEASVIPAEPGMRWSAYWTVTEHDHSSRVRAGENAGETLRHDYVVRQYTPVGDYSGAGKLAFSSLPAQPAHPRQVNLVVFDPRNGRPLQAVSVGC